MRERAVQDVPTDVARGSRSVGEHPKGDDTLVALPAFEDEETRSLDGATTAVGPRLVVVWDGGTVTRLLTPGKALVLGRGKECDIPVLHVTVSRRHARIFPPSTGGPMRVEDLESAHGVRVDGERIKQPREVWPGQIIEVGSAMVFFQDASARQHPTSWPGVDIDRFVTLVAQSHLAVLIVGETGAGKDVMAERIHRASPRKRGPFVRVSCAGLEASSLDGDIEKARGGTLLLDEIEALSPDLQAAILRALEMRLGGSGGARLLAATAGDLDARAREGKFRQDLLYRLSGARVRVPPLRERKHDIVGLAEELAGQGRLTSDAQKMLVSHTWPGNVRELENVLERAAVVAQGGPIAARHITFEVAAGSSTLLGELEAIEKERIVAALAKVSGNQTKAAALLGISRRALINRLDTYGLPRPRKA
jgi:two-component system, NtrC family, response regulator AtoC